MTHHPTWSEVRAEYLSDPEVAAAAEQLHQILIKDDGLYAILSEETNASNGEAFGAAE